MITKHEAEVLECLAGKRDPRTLAGGIKSCTVDNLISAGYVNPLNGVLTAQGKRVLADYNKAQLAPAVPVIHDKDKETLMHLLPWS